MTPLGLPPGLYEDPAPWLADQIRKGGPMRLGWYMGMGINSLLARTSLLLPEYSVAYFSPVLARTQAKIFEAEGAPIQCFSKINDSRFREFDVLILGEDATNSRTKLNRFAALLTHPRLVIV